MKSIQILLLIITLLAACADPAKEKQLLAEQAVLNFETERKADTMLPIPEYYSPLTKKTLKFDFSPEANYFPWLDLKYLNWEYGTFASEDLMNKIKNAHVRKDRAMFSYYADQLDSLEFGDSMFRVEGALMGRARDSCREIYGDRKFYHIVAHDSLDKIIAEYMLDTTSLRVLYWRFSPYEVYRRRDQKVKRHE